METTESTAELERTLYENEEIEWVVQPSATARFVSTGIGSLIGGLIGGGILGFVVFLAITVLFPAFIVFAIPAGIAVAVFVLAWTMRAHVARWLLGTTEYGVSFAEHFLDVGTVTLDTDRGYEGMALSNVPDPRTSPGRSAVSPAAASPSARRSTRARCPSATASTPRKRPRRCERTSTPTSPSRGSSPRTRAPA